MTFGLPHLFYRVHFNVFLVRDVGPITVTNY